MSATSGGTFYGNVTRLDAGTALVATGSYGGTKNAHGTFDMQNMTTCTLDAESMKIGTSLSAGSAYVRPQGEVGLSPGTTTVGTVAVGTSNVVAADSWGRLTLRGNACTINTSSCLTLPSPKFSQNASRPLFQGRPCFSTPKRR